VDLALIHQKAQDARANSRKRETHVLHTGDEDHLQRMVNAIQPGSYVRPHRHIMPPRPEMFILLQGQLGCVCFGEDGAIADDALVLLDQAHGVYGVDLRGGEWHSLVALEVDTVFVSVIAGPYDPRTAKQSAPWSPAPGDTEADRYLAQLEARFRERWDLATDRR